VTVSEEVGGVAGASGTGIEVGIPTGGCSATGVGGTIGSGVEVGAGIGSIGAGAVGISVGVEIVVPAGIGLIMSSGIANLAYLKKSILVKRVKLNSKKCMKKTS
jgi:hypothetical protein